MVCGGWSVRTVFLVVQAVVVLVVLTALFSISAAYYNTEHAVADTEERYERLNHIFQYNEGLRSVARQSLFGSEAPLLEEYTALTASLSQDFESLIADAELPATRTYLGSLRNMFSYLQDSIDEMMGFLQAGDKSAAYRVYGEAIHRSDLIKEVVVGYNTLYARDVSSYTQRRIAEYGRAQFLQTVVAVALLGAALLFLSVTLHSVRKSIRRLVDCTACIAEGDYDFVRRQRFPENSDWGALGAAMQQMSTRIEYYIGEMAEKSRLTVEVATMENERLRMYNAMREAELRALNNQMSPHFIYNTLNIALQMAYEEKAEETASMMRTIIEFLRYHTQNSSAITDLERELQFLRNYLSISRRRYGDRIRFTVDVAEGVENIKLPAVTIQPLVENAIMHGLKDCAEGGAVGISVSSDGAVLAVAVEDNGVGIAYDRIEELMSAEPGSSSHVGLRNVERRLKLFYGDEAGMTIESEVGLGTIVTLHIPISTGQNAGGPL